MFSIAKLSGTYVCVYPHWESYQGAEIVIDNGLGAGHMFGSTFVCHWLIVILLESFCDAFCFDQFAHRNLLIRTLPYFFIGNINALNDISENLLIRVTRLGIIFLQSIREDTLVELALKC